MELVFFYVNQSSSKFIEKVGFNFSANYNFYVDYIDGKYILKQKTCKKTLPPDFFDDQKCITNITAIVGENGAGKTTLLNMLSNQHVSVKKKHPNPAYDDYFTEKYEEDKVLSIYIENDKLICYHNIDNFVNQTEVKEYYLQQGSAKLAEIMRNNQSFNNISKICISNSMYSLEGGVSTDKSISQITLNVNSLKTLKNIFYKKICKRSNSCAEGYYEIQDIICSEKKANDFQQILDILYLQYINKKNIESVFDKNIFKTLKIKFQPVIKYIKDRYQDFSDEKSEESPLIKYFNTMLNSMSSNFKHKFIKTDIFIVIYINFLYELLMYCPENEFNDKTSIHNKEDLVKHIDQKIQVLTQKKDRYSSFFQEAFQEIQEYELVLKTCRIYDRSLPISDQAYVSYKEITYGTTEYVQFLDLIKKSVFEREHSYVLKYIDISGLELASGERALLNFFSWIHLVPYFNYINNNVEESLRKNILLLIDEIDLYCHPLWQQKLIYYLIKEINAEYSDKNVQIIFSTHSPIVLSDMPRSNVIFLKRKDNKCSIDKYDNHEETFGANIYKLFDDAFFLGKKGQIGEFARAKIQSIIDKIKPYINNKNEAIYPSLTEENIDILEQQIDLIGEKILRNKLHEMLYKCKYDSLDCHQKEIKKYEEKIKQLRNEVNI